MSPKTGASVGPARLMAARWGVACAAAWSVWSWHGRAMAFEVVVSAAMVRSPNQTRNEVFALLTFPLDEWFTPTHVLSRLSRHNSTQAAAWNDAEVMNQRDLAGQFGLSQVNTDVETERSAMKDAKSAPASVSGVNKVVLVPRMDAVFLNGLMKACSREFRVSHAELTDLAGRARSSAWLPELQVKGGRNTDETLRLTPTEAEPDRYQLVGGDGVRFEGQLKWSFNQLVFARDELAVARLQGALETEKRRRQQHVIDVLSKWLRAWTVLQDVSQESDKRVTAWIDERAARVELDWLSQGWFGRHVNPAPEFSLLDVPESS